MANIPDRKRKAKHKTRKPTYLELKAHSKINCEVPPRSKSIWPNQAVQ